MSNPASELFRGYRGCVRGGAHKEWFHFIVCMPSGIKILLNYSVLIGVQSDDDTPTARVLAMVFVDGDWFGDVQQLDSIPARGASEIVGHGSLMRVTERGFTLEFSNTEMSLTLDLVTDSPAIMTNRTPVGSGSSLRWLSVPQMRAYGSATVAGQRYPVSAAPAYHDHNWGSFRWGEDYAWDWAVMGGYGDRDPVYIYCQFTDADSQACVSRTLTACEFGRSPRPIVESFVPRRSGLRSARQPFRLPKGMQLAMPGWRVDVPKKIELRTTDGNRLLATVKPLRSAQIVIPGDSSDGADALLTESVGEATFGDSKLAVSGWSVLEQLRRQG